MTRTRDVKRASDFALAGEAAANRLADVHEKITLPARDWEVFHDTLLKPPKPNRKLREAARRYRKRIDE